MGEIISVVSGKGGVGKTTCAWLVGSASAELNRSVLIADLSEGASDLELFGKYAGRTAYHYLDVLEGNCRISDAFCEVGENHLYVLPAPKKRLHTLEKGLRLQRLILTLKKEFDLVLLDVPAHPSFIDLSEEVSDRSLVVTTLHAPSLRALKGLTERIPERVPGLLVINRVLPSRVREGVLRTPEEIVEESGLPLIGLIPEDPAAEVLSDEPALRKVRSFPAGEACFEIAERLNGKDVPFHAPKAGRGRRG